MPGPLERWRLNRRQTLQIGALGGFGLTLPRLLRAESESSRSAQSTGSLSAGDRVRSCILVFYYGGPSHLDTFDMKPRAPVEVRGEFASIATSAPGVQVCEHLPMTARVMDRVAVIRSMHHPMRNHNSAAVEALCGRTPLGGDLELLADDALSHPCYGAVLNYVWRHERRTLSTVALPHVMYNIVPLPGQSAGFLGSPYQPFQIEKDPNDEDFAASVLSLPAEVSANRLSRRQALLERLDGRGDDADRALAVNTLAGYYSQAFDLLQSESVRRSLEIDKEPAATRERFGRNTLGQSLLLARRLVEAGVRFVTVYDGARNCQTCNWDSHVDNFARHKDVLIPPADRAFSALIEDLEDRGLLDSTLVVELGEFGRTPRINGAGGRDHWPDCFSVVLAGGGIRGGRVYGSSDRIGAYPATDPVTPANLAATLFWYCGIDPSTELHDVTGRPHRLAEAEPLRELFAAGA